MMTRQNSREGSPKPNNYFNNSVYSSFSKHNEPPRLRSSKADTFRWTGSRSQSVDEPSLMNSTSNHMINFNNQSALNFLPSYSQKKYFAVVKPMWRNKQ